ncbi:hypothetical protein K440DRAFT_533004 [Wilcoxina mikolae CBS 423.85]|nr:hypothetical protein K440DRAFT_533004 [Wilcoxina mikolae CBS 423.85]
MSTTTTTRKPPPTSNVNRRSQPPGVASPGRQSPAPAAPSSIPTSGIARRNTIREGGHRPTGSISGSPLSARSAVKTRPLSSDETEFENAAILEDIRSRLAKSESAAEAAAEEYAKQIKALQMRLDEAQADYARIEDHLHSKDETIDDLEMQIKDLTRSKRDQENIYEAERIAAQQEKEELLDREEELNTIIQRLKDTLSQRQPTPERERQNCSNNNSNVDESITFAPSSHSPVPQNSLLLQKDKVIESLRLELAEAQIRLAEADHLGGTKLQQLEQQLLEVRMTNARLMEDNESFQLLLSSAALNGDFPRGDYLSNAFSDPDPEPESDGLKKVPGSPRNSMLGLNLAEELGGAGEVDIDEDALHIKKLEGELKSLKEQNKAMSLYISGIIERILQHKDSEAILDKTAPLGGSAADVEKPLPPKPVEEEQTGILQRTKSLAQRKAPPPFRPENMNGPLQRSQSYRGPTGGHKRSQSDIGHLRHSNNIYRGEGLITPRASTFYGGPPGEHYTRSPRPRDSSASVDSGVSDTDNSSVSSPPHPSTPIGPIAGNKLRPLTLVQKNVSNGMMSPPLGGRKISGDYMDQYTDDGKTDSKRSSKRQSWYVHPSTTAAAAWIRNDRIRVNTDDVLARMGWFNRGKEESVTPPASVAESVVFEGKDVE